MKPNTDIRRANEALHRATEARPDDFDHPGYDQLEAFVDGRLGDVDREIVDTHVELCAVCSQDVADLAAVRGALRGGTTAGIGSRALPMRALQIAAAILVIVGLGMFVRQRLAGPESPALQASDAALRTNSPAIQPTGTPAQPGGATESKPAGDSLTADERAVVDRVLAAGKLEMPSAVRALGAPVGTLLGEEPVASTLKPLSPIGTAVLSVTPEFSWRAVAGATSYTVAVYDERFTEVARSPRVTGTSWTPTSALPRGATFAWQVQAHLADRDVLAPEPPQPEARFMVVDQKTDAAVAAANARLEDQPLALGVLLAKAGLFADASRELARAAQQPATADQAKRLIASLKR